MNVRLPSIPAIYGLCAAFFLVASIRMVSYLAASLPFWPHDAPWLVWTQALAVLLFSVVSAYVGVRLLYARPHCLLHGLLLGWLCLAVTVYNQVTFIYSVSHNSKLYSDWWVHLPSLISPVLFCIVVVGLLHTVRSREHGGGDRLLANVQVAQPRAPANRSWRGSRFRVPALTSPASVAELESVIDLQLSKDARRKGQFGAVPEGFEQTRGLADGV